MFDLCEKVGADFYDVAKGIGLDKRIGSKFLHPGPGYVGSCLPKDTQASLQTAKDYDLKLSLVETVVQYYKQRKSDMADKIIEAFNNNCQNKRNQFLVFHLNQKLMIWETALL